MLVAANGENAAPLINLLSCQQWTRPELPDVYTMGVLKGLSTSRNVAQYIHTTCKQTYRRIDRCSSNTSASLHNIPFCT